MSVARAAAAVALALALFHVAGCQEVRRRVEDYFVEPEVRKALGDIPDFRNDAQPVETVRLPMRDGVELETHIYRPVGEGPWASTWCRTGFD